MRKEAATTKQWVNQFFNPLAKEEDRIPMESGNKLKQALVHGLTLATGYGGSAYLLRELRNSLAKPDEEKAKEKIQAYTKARFPQHALINEKRAALDHDAHLALAFAAMVAGGYGGYKLADSTVAERGLRETDDEIDSLRKKQQRLIKEEYARTRGLTGSEKTAADDESYANKLWSGSKQAYLVYAAAALAVAYRGAKKMTDSSDPNRQALKNIEDVAKERAKTSQAPVMMSGSVAPRGKGSLKREISQKDMRAIPVSDLELEGAGTSGLKTPTDPSDPYAGLLG